MIAIPTGATALQATAATLNGSVASASSSAPSSLNFSQLLTAKTQNQDPSNPTSPAAGQGISQLNQTLTSLLAMQGLSQGVSLIGKTVSYTNSAGQTASGTVSSVAMVGGQLKMVINNTNVGLSQIQTVQEATKKISATTAAITNQSLAKGLPMATSMGKQ